MARLTFIRKPMPVIPEHRPMLKIAMILLVLRVCSIGGKSSLIRLHLFNWAWKDENRMKCLIHSAEKKELAIGVWGVDPALNMGLSYAISNGLVAKQKNGSYKITTKGDEFFDDVKLTSLFEEEMKLLCQIGKKITEVMVKDVAKGWENEA